MYWIGIDPGRNIGLAVWNSKIKIFEELVTYRNNFNKFRRDMNKYAEAWNNVKVVLEATYKKNHVWETPGRPLPTSLKEIRKLLRIARNVGMNQGAALEIKHLLQYLNLPFIEVVQGTSPTKLEVEYFRKISKWEGKVSEHSIDAAMLVIGRK